MKRILASMLIAGLLPSVQADTGADDVAGFVSSNTRWNDETLYGESATLYLAIANTPTDAPAETRMAVASASLAQKWRISEANARTLIVTMIEGSSRRFGVDHEALMTRVKSQFRELLHAQPDSPEVWALAVRFWDDEDECGDTRIRDEYLARPFAAERFVQLDSCLGWTPAFARLNPGNTVARLVLADWLADRDSAAALAAARWAIDGVPRDGVSPSELRLFAIRRYWALLGMNGLTSILADEAARNADRDALLHRRPDGELRVDGVRIAASDDNAGLFAATRRQWLLALITAGRLDEARDEMRAHPTKGDDGYLADAVAGRFRGDIYARYVDDGKEEALGERQEEVWISYDDGATGMRVAARFLAANRMESSATMLLEDACDQQGGEHGGAKLESDLAAMPREFREYWSQAAARLAEARRAAGCSDGRRSPRHAMSSQLTTYPEVPLDAGEKSLNPLPDYPDTIPLPVAFDLVRAERQGDEIRAICLSPAVDPGGEVSPGGYWLVRSTDGGAHWQRPIYLGFQHQAPYVVSAPARISMFAPGVLRLEVEVAEIAPESITFPPTEMSLRREARDLRIDMPLADLERDQDGDGFTDLLEARLATDPRNPDTDGDGLSDGLDDFPQASARGRPGPLGPILVDALARISGYEQDGIVEPVRRSGQGTSEWLSGLRGASAGSMLFHIIEGDPRMFAGMRADRQVIVLSREQVEDIAARYGPFYPVSFTILLDPGRTRALVMWGAEWISGSITYKLRNGRWVGKEGSTWITRAPLTSAPSTSPG